MSLNAMTLHECANLAVEMASTLNEAHLMSKSDPERALGLASIAMANLTHMQASVIRAEISLENTIHYLAIAQIGTSEDVPPIPEDRKHD